MKSPVDSAAVPRRRGGVEVERVGAAAVVFDGANIHTLNPSASTILEQCNGEATVAAIAARLSETYGVDGEIMLGDVAATVSSLLELGVVDIGADAVVSKPILEPVPVCASCGPGPTYDVHVVVDLGDDVLTVGAPRRVGRALAAALGPRAVGMLEGPGARPSYGVVIPTSSVSERGPHDVARLHRGPDVLLRSRRPGRVVEALLTVISHHLSPDTARLDGLALRGDRGVILVTPPRNRVAFERQVGRFGIEVGNLATVVLAGSAIRVGPVDLDVDPGALDLAGTATREDPEPRTVPPGRYPVVAVATVGAPTPANVLAELGPLRTGRAQPLDQLRAFAVDVPIRSASTPDEMALLLGMGRDEAGPTASPR